MSDYTDKVLSFSPVAFWYLNQLMLEEGMVDLSGNGFHGIFRPEIVVFGQPSPIETDAASFSIGGMVGYYHSVGISGSLVDVRTAFTLIAWGLNDGAAWNKTLLSRVGSPTHGSFVGIYISTGSRASASISFDSGETYNLVDPVELPTGHFPMIAVARVGAFMGLYVDAVLVAQRTDLPTGDLIWAPYNDGGWKVGYGNASGSATSGATGSVWQATQTCSVIIVPTALNGSQLAEIHDSALNATFLSGSSNVIPTAILDGSDDPDPITFPFRHNWTNDLIERVSFRTSIAQAKTGPEEARKVRPKPRREIEIHQMLRDDRDRNALRSKLWASQHAKWFIPILEDREQIGSQTSGTTIFPITTAFKDYQAQGWLHVRELDAFERITKSENLEILSFAANSVTTLTGLSDDYDGIVEGCPARRAIVRASSNRGHTDAVEDLVITARLLAEDEPETPNRITSWTPTQTYLGYEVFRDIDWQSNDWSELREYELDRQLKDVDFESGVFGVESDTPGNQESFSYRIWIKGREKNSQFLGWFYDRAGSAKYLWAPSMQKDFTILSTGGFGEFTVQGTVYSDSYVLAEARRDLAFVYNDGSIILRRVTAFSKGSGQETLTVDSSVPTLTNLRSVSLLKFCRLDSDQLEIAKRTDDIWIYAWRFRELLESPS